MDRLERATEKYNGAPEIDSAISKYNLTKVSPEILQVILLDELTGRIAEYLSDRTSNGYIQTWGSDSPLTITDELEEFKMDYPAQSGAISNDGATNDVYVWINSTMRRKHKIKPSETFNINLETHKLNCLWLKCDKGGSTTVRITVKN